MSPPLGDASLSALLDAAPDAVVIVAHDGMILRVNRAAERMFERPALELIGSSVELLVPEAARAAHAARRAAYARAPRRRDMGSGLTLTALIRGGREIPVEIAISPLRTPDGLEVVYAAIRDVSERQHLERLARSERDSTIATMASGLAHELNNPLATIIANLDFAQHTLAELIAAEGAVRAVEPLIPPLVPPAPPLSAQLVEIGEALADTADAAARVRRLIQHLRGFGGADPGPRERLRLETALDAALHGVGPKLNAVAHVVRDYGETAAIEAVGGRLVQVFTQLLNNAIHAVRARPRPSHTIHVRTALDGAGHPYAEVADTGGGVAPDHLPRLFEPFFTTKLPGEGAGLGLALCRSIVSDLGGSITVESEVDRGTTIRVTIPRAA